MLAAACCIGTKQPSGFDGGIDATVNQQPTHSSLKGHLSTARNLQVKRDIKRRSQELPHETLSTMLADYGDGPASALINAAYHPNPVRRIDLELPPSAAALRRSIELQARAEVAGRGSGAAPGGSSRREHGGAAGGSGALAASGELLGSSGSAMDLLESLLQQGKAAGGRTGRSASVPTAAGDGTGGAPGWLGSVPLSSAANLRGSMLATESTFIFPAGLQPSATAAAAAGADHELGGGSSAARHEPGELGGATSAWDCSWQPQQGQVPSTRHTTSAPGYSSSKAGEWPGPSRAIAVSSWRLLSQVGHASVEKLHAIM